MPGCHGPTARLDEGLGALRIALTRRDACPVLAELLADWDGQLTEQTRNLVVWHIEECQTCANHKRGALRPAAFSHLLPLAPLPPELREQVLSRCTSTTEDAVAYRRRLARRAEPTWFSRFSQAVRQLSWASIRANPGAAIATVAVTVWVAAAVSVSLLTFAGSHAAQAQVAPAARPDLCRAVPRATTAVASTTRAAAPTSAAARPSPTVSQPRPTCRLRSSHRRHTRPRCHPRHQPRLSRRNRPRPSPSHSPSPTTSPTTSATASPTG